MLTLRLHQRGFTLVELMIGVVIMSILFAAAAPSFKDWIQNAQLRTAAESISAGLQLARSEAVRRNTSVNFSLPGVNSTWFVGCFTPIADSDGDGVAECPGNIQSRNSEEGSSNAVVAVNNAIITFNGLGRASNIMTVILTNPTGGNCIAAGGSMHCLNILVTTGGQIRMCDPALPPAGLDPQGC